MLIRNIAVVMIIAVIFLFLQNIPAQTKEQLKEKNKSETEINNQRNEPAKPWNAICPVRGGEVDKDVDAVEYHGKYYGFCCIGCDAKFKKDPGKYSKNLSDDGKKFLNKNS